LYCNRSVVLKNISIDNAKLIKSDAPLGHYRYRLAKPLQPGDSINMQFEIDYSWSPYNRHDPVNAIVENGSFMRISRYYPIFGYQAGNEIENEAERTRRKMAAATPLKKLEDSSVDDYGFINFEAVISTTEKQTAIGTGELVKNWTEKGRNYFHYRSPVPIPFRFAVSSAEYAVKRTTQNGISIEAYYHSTHAENVAHLVEEAKNTIVYCEKNFGKYPFKSIRFAEISGFTEGFAATAYPGSIFMSESVVFHADIRKDDKRDVINELAGHELSHAWWGNNQIAPEEREGSAMLTETLAMYTELMLYKQRHGDEAVKQVVAMHQSIYENGRIYSTNEPLYKVQPGNNYLAYNKGLVVMYELYKLIGEEKINTALRNFLTKHAFPNKPPTTVDLINAFLEVSNTAVHGKIKKLFM
jgi:ABC-2 type transport system permease protein